MCILVPFVPHSQAASTRFGYRDAARAIVL
jgi:hypothetical protein